MKKAVRDEAIWPLPNGEKKSFKVWQKALRDDLSHLEDNRSSSPANHSPLVSFLLALEVEKTIERYGLAQRYKVSPKVKVFNAWLLLKDLKLKTQLDKLEERYPDDRWNYYNPWNCLRDFKMGLSYSTSDFCPKSIWEDLCSENIERAQYLHKENFCERKNNLHAYLEGWSLIVHEVCNSYENIIRTPLYSDTRLEIKDLERVLDYLHVDIALAEAVDEKVYHFFILRAEDDKSVKRKLTQYGFDMPPVTCWTKIDDTKEKRDHLVARFNQQKREEQRRISQALSKAISWPEVKEEVLSDEELLQKKQKKQLEFDKRQLEFEEERKQRIESFKTPERPHGLWEHITEEQLKVLVWTKSTEQLSREIGISGNAIAKRCKKFGIVKPARGFWAKVAAGKLPNPEGVPIRES